MVQGFRLVAVFATLLFLPGCVTDRSVSEHVRAGGQWASVALFDEKSHVLSPSEHAYVAKDGLNILALSGGGADGAFGAGLLVGWSEAGTRPEFDIVTGVSTGALMSTLVFLGPAYDSALTALYTATQSHHIYSARGIDGLLGDSLLDTSPLKTKIAGLVTAEMLDAVAAEHRKGRRLFVATTNLDSGTLVVWNMGAIAASNDAGRLELYREILRASAAVPGFFKPVMIRPSEPGNVVQMHVDGGVKAPVLLRSFMLGGQYPKKNVYILVNGPLKLRTNQSAVPAQVTGIAKKSITELLRGLLYKTIYQSYVTVQRAGATFHLAFTPDDVPETADPLVFDPTEMTRLFEAGREFSLSRENWRREPPRLENLERVDGPRRAPAPKRDAGPTARAVSPAPGRPASASAS